VNAWRLVRPTDVLLFVVLAGLVGGVGTVVFRRQLFASRVVTAQEDVNSIASGIGAAFERHESRSGNRWIRTLCRSALPVPRDVAQIRGKAYAHRPDDWNPSDAASRETAGPLPQPSNSQADASRETAGPLPQAPIVGFPCLGYTGPESKLLYFQMSYTSDSSATSPGTAFEVTARGDLDGDGDLSRIRTGGTVDDLSIRLRPTVDIENPEE
jgi:hypothetical protein